MALGSVLLYRMTSMREVHHGHDAYPHTTCCVSTSQPQDTLNTGMYLDLGKKHSKWHKSMQKLSICVGQGQEQGVGGKGLGSRGGSWNSSQVTAAHILLWVGMWGCGVGQWWGRGGWWGRGWGEAFIEVFNKTGIVTHLGCRNKCYDTKSYTKSRGIPNFWGNPPVMTSRSRKYVIISPKKSPKTRRREISANYLCKKEQPYWKSEKLAHLRISNSIYEAMAAYFL